MLAELSNGKMGAVLCFCLWTLGIFGYGVCEQMYMGHQINFRDIFTYSNTTNTIFIPDRGKVFPGRGQLLNFSYYSVAGSSNSSEEIRFMILVLNITNPSSYSVYSRSSWISVPFSKYNELKHITLDKTITVLGGTVIGFHFSDEIPFARYYPLDVKWSFPYQPQTRCFSNGTLETYHDPEKNEYQLNDKFSPTEKSETCSLFSYYAYYASHDGKPDNCTYEELRYEYGYDSSNTLVINGYPINRMEQELNIYETFCWTVSAPPTDDGNQHVVNLRISTMQTSGNEIVHPDGYKYCYPGAWIELIDTNTQQSMFNICSLYDQKWDEYFSISNNMTVKFTTGDHPEVLAVKVKAGSSAEAPEGYYKDYKIDEPDSSHDRPSGESTPPYRLAMYAVGGLILLALVVSAIYKLHKRSRVQQANNAVSTTTNANNSTTPKTELGKAELKKSTIPPRPAPRRPDRNSAPAPPPAGNPPQQPPYQPQVQPLLQIQPQPSAAWPSPSYQTGPPPPQHLAAWPNSAYQTGPQLGHPPASWPDPAYHQGAPPVHQGAPPVHQSAPPVHQGAPPVHQQAGMSVGPAYQTGPPLSQPQSGVSGPGHLTGPPPAPLSMDGFDPTLYPGGPLPTVPPPSYGAAVHGSSSGPVPDLYAPPAQASGYPGYNPPPPGLPPPAN